MEFTIENVEKEFAAWGEGAPQHIAHIAGFRVWADADIDGVLNGINGINAYQLIEDMVYTLFCNDDIKAAKIGDMEIRRSCVDFIETHKKALIECLNN